MFIYIFSAIFIYLIIGLFLFFLQRRITFNKAGVPNKPKDYGLNNVSEIFINTPDNLKLLAWYKKPQNNNSKLPILIYFHGNSFDIGERAYRIKRYIDIGWGVLLLAWRGFSGNKGNPTENNLYIDGQAAIDWIQKSTGYNKKNIILYGESLGCGVAVELGLKDTFKSVILEAPFTSIIDIGQKKYPIYPVRYLALDHFNNLNKIERIKSPLLIVHGKNDEIIPYTHSIKLFQKANEPKKHVLVDEAMHNNLYDFNIDKDVISFIDSL